MDGLRTCRCVVMCSHLTGPNRDKTRFERRATASESAGIHYKGCAVVVRNDGGRAAPAIGAEARPRPAGEDNWRIRERGGECHLPEPQIWLEPDRRPAI